MPLPFVAVPVGDGYGFWFTWASNGTAIAVYDHPTASVSEVHGAILMSYIQQGGPLSSLGYPVSDEYEEEGFGRVNDFQHGSIFWSRTTGKTTIMTIDPLTEFPSVQFANFLNAGTGLTGKPLGETSVLSYIQNGVELQFSVDTSVQITHKNLQPAQWSGPEAIWVKEGDPAASNWQLHRRSEGDGSDDPMPENVLILPEMVAYYDSPGPNVAAFMVPRRSRIWAVQNFTSWNIGHPVAGGPAERLCPVTAWHSILNLADSNWSIPGSFPSWGRFTGSTSDLGWGDTLTPPPL